MNPTKPLKNLIFHTILEKEVYKIGYGQLTFNVVLKDGEALINTMRVTRSRRKRYPLKQRSGNEKEI
jgi:hypothetical protein